MGYVVDVGLLVKDLVVEDEFGLEGDTVILVPLFPLLHPSPLLKLLLVVHID